MNIFIAILVLLFVNSGCNWGELGENVRIQYNVEPEGIEDYPLQ